MITVVSWNIAMRPQAVEELVAMEAATWRSSKRWARAPWRP